MTIIPSSHPRYKSLIIRARIEEGVTNGITSIQGLIAHGRGEAFDYLLAEKTHEFSLEAIKAAATMLISAKYPVISVNGNTAALVPQELVRLAVLLKAPIEVNLFHTSQDRILKIKSHLLQHGAPNILLPDKNHTIPYLDSDRKYVNARGIYIADVVFVPLEDGDRTEALIKNGKKVITVDLNPLSRTAQKATVTIVDNIIRAMPLLIEIIDNYKNNSVSLDLTFDNRSNLKRAIEYIRGHYCSDQEIS